jgi:hypothetical protein
MCIQIKWARLNEWLVQISLLEANAQNVRIPRDSAPQNFPALGSNNKPDGGFHIVNNQDICIGNFG